MAREWREGVKYGLFFINLSPKSPENGERKDKIARAKHWTGHRVRVELMIIGNDNQ